MGPALVKVLPWLAGSLAVIVAISLFQKPLDALLRLAGRTGVGLAFLTLFAPLGQALGASLGVNLFNAAVLGALGVPGFGLLLMLRWVLH